VSRVKGQKTPDLGAEAKGQKIMCDCKTFNRSDVEVARISGGGVAEGTDVLSDGFINKLKKDLEYAKAQMLAYDPDPCVRKIAYVFFNYDDHEYADRFEPQLLHFQSTASVPGLEFVFETRPYWG
jgi:hypothetical protein